MRKSPERTELDTTRSAECALAQRPAYETLHAQCRQAKNVPLPHAMGLLLMPRCSCPCHRPEGGKA
ncbi:hypothetical protein OEB94_09185 [Streptomyces sp. ICN988]|uniref:hypothetical protein n=1 Tax=Streptomyces sp. ICN988 TaxID=2983765 RepID=UPI0021E37754|nr:hypothetical protein [Streptomyces sp. ICN988]MCV2459433.1 hypothetical protein [Streptomyces sp. ICN988]